MEDYNYPQQPAPKKKSPRWLVIGAISLVIGLLCLCGGLLVSSNNNDGETHGRRALAAPSVTAGPATDSPNVPVEDGKPQTLTKKDIGLKVKVTKKECFGSAGCNVIYKMDAAISETGRLTLDAGQVDYEVTYQVTGFDEGAQIGTLTLHPDGTYTQDSFLSGSIPRSSTVLKAKVTDIERG